MKYKNEEIVLIEYHDKKPFSVVTTRENYDFELDPYGNGYMHFHSGGGRNVHCGKIQLYGKLAYPQNPPVCQLWVKPGIKIIGNTKGYEILKKPIRLKGDFSTSINPFKVSREVIDIIYCEQCEKYYDEYGCEDHFEEVLYWN